MTSVRALPRAEQYPSSTASSSAGTSSLISGISSSFGSAELKVQSKQRRTLRPFRFDYLARTKLRKRTCGDTDTLSDLRLGKSSVLDFSDDLIPVHNGPFSINRNITLRQVETQVTENLPMNTLAKRLIEARTDLGWSKADLKRAAKLGSASTLTEIENGKRTKSPQLAKIAHVLGVSAMWLQHGKGPKHIKTIEGTSRRIDEKITPEPASTVTFKSERDRQLDELVAIARTMSDKGLLLLTGSAMELVKQHPAQAKQTPESFG